MRVVSTLAGLALAVVLVSVAGAATSAGSAFRQAVFARGFSNPVLLTHAPGEPGTVYVVEQNGRVIRLRSGRRTVFLDVRRDVQFGGEQGLLGLAFHPRYARNRLLYVAYTSISGRNVVARFRSNRTRAVPSSRKILLSVPDPYGNHNGGHLAFGPNGRLYTGMGDGGGACDPSGRAQNLSSRHGKLLSLDPAAIGAGWRIDGYGLRNPWGFSFDRANGRLYIGDVGQGQWEEVSTRAPATLGGVPENYLWDVYEGRRRSGCSTGGLRGSGTRVFPISVYSHSEGCSITGGYAYRGRAIPGLRGWFVFADFCSGRVWRLLYNNGLRRGRSLMFDSPHNITSFGEGVGGELYVTHQGGTVYRLARS